MRTLLRLPKLNLFTVASFVCLVVAVLGLAVPELLSTAANAVTRTAFGGADWFFMASVTAFVGLCLWLAVSDYGRIRLGKEDERPEFSTASWLAMLFAAGMGVGLLFWGAAEPMLHYLDAPGAEPGTSIAARRALVITSFHWGIHAWAIYGAAALVIAYFGFRKGRPYLPGEPIRAAFSGRWVQPVAHLANLVAILAVVFGVAGSMAMGTFQLHTGLHLVARVPADSAVVPWVIMVVLVISYTISASTSLDKGIKWLSNINMTLALLLVLFVLLAGPTSALLRSFVTGVGDYLTALPSLTLGLYPYEDVHAWLSGWTLTYFIWWIAWAPFVGVFIARISRGRTIREFVFGVLLAPTVFSVFWFAVFGGLGLHRELAGGGVAELVREDVTLALFALFDTLPLSGLLSVVALILVFVFLITSVDSATFVLGMLTSGGSLNPPRSKKLVWGAALGGLGAALMLSKDIEAVKAVSILGAVPFAFIMLIQIAALVRTLRQDKRREQSDG